MTGFLAQLLGEMPPFLALLRSIECGLYQPLQPWPEPVLEIGIGDGCFAAAAWRQPPLVGIDCDVAMLRRVRAAACRHRIAASATRLPFPDGRFKTVVANSVLEHIPDLDGALAEIERVLAVGGRFCFTVPSHRFGDLLLGSTLPRSIGLRALGGAYARWFNRRSRHFHTDGPEVWRRRLQQRGFRITSWRYYSCAATHRVFDPAHYLSLPNLFMHAITGRWVLRPGSLVQRIWGRVLRPFAQRESHAEGPYLFFDAVKVGRR